MRRPPHLLSAFAGAVLTAGFGAAAGLASPLDAGFGPEERRGLEAIAELPPALSRAALVAGRHPELLVQVPGWRAEVDARLGGLLFGLDPNARERLERLAPHPDLVEALLSQRDRDLETSLARWPSELQDAARAAQSSDEAQLRQLNALQRQARARAGAALAGLPEDERAAFLTVLDEPGLAELLLDHLRASQMLAAAHAGDPGGTEAELARIRGEVARARELEAAAQAAREQAAREAAEEEARRSAERRLWRGWDRPWGWDSPYGPWASTWGWSGWVGSSHGHHHGHGHGHPPGAPNGGPPPPPPPQGGGGPPPPPAPTS